MYEYLRGFVTFVSPYYIVVEVNGIGYQIAAANPFRYEINKEKEVVIYLYQAVREDALTLYGFANLEEKQLFIKLISVSGIGPKSGLAIMAGDDHGGLVKAIESEDHNYLTKFPGVGKKTAQQMILDLKGKLGELVDSDLITDGQKTSASPVTTITENQALAEALEALKALGYSEREVKRITQELEQQAPTTTDSYLRYGLKLLLKK